MLIKDVITVLFSTKSLPNRISHISTLSCARLGSVTDPMKGLSDNSICANNISK